MKVDRGTFQQFMKSVTDNIFPREMVCERPDYINSATMQGRKPLRADTEINSVGQRGFALRYNLPEWLPNTFTVGPYELNLLAEFIKPGEGYLFYRGGSRSGKSSAINFLQNYCENYLGNLPDMNQTISNRDGGFLSPVPKSIKVLIVDVGNYDSGLKENEDYGTEFLDGKLRDFMSKLSSMILQEFKNSCEDQEDFLKHCKEAYRNTLYTFKGIDTFSEVISRLSGHPSWDDWEGSSANRKEAIINKIIMSPTDPSDVLIAAIIPLWYKAQIKTSDDRNIKIILVVDNIDPQPTFFQQKIAEKIRSICSTPAWKRQFDWDGFKIVVPVRLSTYKRRIGQLGGSFVNIEHESFYPSDIISYRLNFFFLTKGEFSPFKDLHATYKNAIALRLYSIWSHLADQRGYFRTMLDSLSGTNINHANSFVQNLCLCTNINFGKTDGPDVIETLFQNFERVACESLLREEWQSTLRALEWALTNNLSKDEANPDKLEVMAVECARDFSKILGEVFRDHRVLCHPDGRDTEGTRRRIAKQLRIIFEDTLKKQIRSSMRNMKLVNQHAKDIVYSVLVFNSDNRKCRKFLKEFIEEIKRSLPDSLLEECSVFQESYNESLAESLGNWLLLVLKKAKSVNIADLRVKQLADNKENDIPYHKTFLGYAPKISRFEAGWHLLQPRGIPREDIITAENVMTLSKFNFRPCALHVLYKLYYSEEYESVMGDLLDLLELYRYDFEKQILPVLQNLIRIDRRLIFCDVNDYEHGIKNIVEKRNLVVFLSSTGKGYIKNLVISPPYLQWCFMQPGQEVDIHDINGKVNAVSAAMKKVIDFEIERLDNIKKNLKRDEVMKDKVPGYLCASLDVWIRAMDYYLPGLSSHLRNLRADNEDDSITIELMKEIISNCKSQATRIGGIFGYRLEEQQDDRQLRKWQENITWAEKHFSDRTGYSL